MKYCRNCKVTVDEDVKFCTTCGERLDEIQIREENTNKRKKDKLITNQQSLGKKSTFKKVLIVILSIIIIFSGVGVVFHKPILEKYYTFRGDGATGSEKIKYYISAMKYSDDKSIQDKIYLLLKEGDFENNIRLAESLLETKDYKDLCIKYYLEKVDSAYIRGEYIEAYKYLDNLASLGYNKFSYENYSKIENVAKRSSNYNSNSTNSTYNVTENISDIITTKNYNMDFVIEDSNRRLLTTEELTKLSLNELAIARNEIFARYGYDFLQEPFKSYFRGKSWYKVNPSFKGSYEDLSEIEKRNVETIKALEGL